MEAAKRMFDNSYEQRQETAALARAYLDNEAEAKPEEEVIRREKRNRATGMACSLFGIVMAMVYCFVIFGILTLPLMKETELQKINVQHSTFKGEIQLLESEIQALEEKLEKEVDPTLIRQLAEDELGMIFSKDAIRKNTINVEMITLDEAREDYFRKDSNLVSEGDK
jgi:hypothetical protein